MERCPFAVIPKRCPFAVIPKRCPFAVIPKRCPFAVIPECLYRGTRFFCHARMPSLVEV